MFAFEPGPTPLSFLREVAKENRYSNIEVIPCALSNRIGTTTFYETDVILAKGYGRIDRRPSEKFANVTATEVEVLSPCDAFERYGIQNPSFIKIDVEGQEKNVIRGLEPLFDSGVFPLLMTEITNSPSGIDELEGYAPLLRKYGYSMCRAIVSLPHCSVTDFSSGFRGNVFWVIENQLQSRRHINRV